jgi:catechol 2,3-dioxygenase-like lactoylglutathione lyase family enzyme
MKLEHVALNLKEPHQSARWYQEHMGLKIVKASEEAPFIHFLADDAGSMLEFYSNPLGEIPDYASINPFTLHLAFTSDDVAGTRERLEAAGASTIDEISTTPTGDQLLFMRDPWGLCIQILKRSKPF